MKTKKPKAKKFLPGMSDTELLNALLHKKPKALKKDAQRSKDGTTMKRDG